MNILFEVFLALRLFIIPFEYANYLTIGFGVLSVIIFVISLFSKSSPLPNMSYFRRMNWILVALTMVYIFIVVFTPYSFIYTSELYATVLIAYIYFFHFRFDGLSKGFRAIALISTVLQMAICVMNSEVFYLSSVMEKSITSCVVFIMMCIEFKSKRYIPMLIYGIGLIWSSFGNSYISNRTAILLILVFVVVITVQAFGKNEPRNLWIVEKSQRYFVISTIAIFVISFVWCEIAIRHGVSNYHGSLMDTSNYIRMNSNLYVLGQIKQNPKLLLFGYDTEIYDAMSLGVGSGYSYFNGLRVVQAHHSILDVFQRCGLLFTFVYFIMVSSFFNNSKVKEKNEILLPIYAIAMIMHSYLQNECLLIILVALNCTYLQEGRRIVLADHKITFIKNTNRNQDLDTS